MKIYVDFDTKLPLCTEGAALTRFFFVAQWFPKFGVYDRRDEIATGVELSPVPCQFGFYSNHSLYEVNIAPSNML